MAIKMIKAFSKTELKKISPSFNQLLEEMLATLPTPKKKSKQLVRKTHSESANMNHKREFSFANRAPNTAAESSSVG